MGDPVNRSGNGWSSPREGNRVPATLGISETNPDALLPLEINPLSGGLLAATAPSSVNVGQTVSNVTAVQLTNTSIPEINGIFVQALSTNVSSVFVGGSSVTTSTGFELQAGQCIPFTCTNITSLYIIGANNTDGVCWSVV